MSSSEKRPISIGMADVLGAFDACDDSSGDRTSVLGARWILRSDALDIPDYVWRHIPEPTGWNVLVQEYVPPERTRGGLILADPSVEYQASLNYIGRVLALGPSCYQHSKFGCKDWVYPGLWVAFKRFTSLPLKIDHDGKTWRFRMLSDDTIDGILPRPDVITVYVPS